MKKISEKTTVKEALEIKGAEEVLVKNNFPCLSCPMASFELDELEIGKVCEMYGLNSKKIIKALQKLK